MTVEVELSKQVQKFLAKNTHLITKDRLYELLNVVARQHPNAPGTRKLIGDSEDYYRLRFRNARVIFRVEERPDLMYLYARAMDYRGNIY